MVKIFDSWAGSLKGDDFYKYALEPTKKIVMELKAKYPTVPIIAFPRQAGDYYKGFLKSTGADCLAIDDSISSAWAAKYLQKDGCIQGNLNSSHMVSGGQNMIDEIETIVSDLSQGPHIFNLGHGITPDCLAIDDSISSAWAAKYLQKDGCIQGNLNSSHMVSGGQNMIDEIETIVSDLSQGPHIFNLGHGITPEANPDNVALMIETIRNFKRS